MNQHRIIDPGIYRVPFDDGTSQVIKVEAGDVDGWRFLKCWTPDTNEQEWFNFARIAPPSPSYPDGKVRPTPGTEHKPESKQWAAALALHASDPVSREGILFDPETELVRCRRCGKPLKDQMQILAGVGPDCAVLILAGH